MMMRVVMSAMSPASGGNSNGSFLKFGNSTRQFTSLLAKVIRINFLSVFSVSLRMRANSSGEEFIAAARLIGWPPGTLRVSGSM